MLATFLMTSVFVVCSGAQVSAAIGSIRGVVSDRVQNDVSGASIALSWAPGEVLRSKSGADCAFLVGPLPPAVYILTVKATGYAPMTLESVAVHVRETTLVAPAIGSESAAFRVDVTVPHLPINFSQTQLASTIDRSSIERLPINRRDYLDFALLTPLVAETTNLVDGANYRPRLTPAAGVGFAANNGRRNSFLVDGIFINGGSYNVRRSLPQVGVQEFQVNRSGYTAELGGSSGGTVSIVSRFGSNTWSGEAFGYLRHSRLQARNHFDRSRMSNTRVQPGGDFSGPLGHRTFLFAGLESLDGHDSVFAPILEDSSVFSRLTPWKRLFGYLAAAGNPSLQTLAAAFQFALTPSKTSVTRIFQQNTGMFPCAARSDQFSVRVDHHTLSQKLLFARLNFSREHTDNCRLGALGGLSNGSSSRWFDQNYLLGAHWLFSPALQSEPRIAIADSRVRILPIDYIGPEVQFVGDGQFGRNSLLPLDQRERYLEFQGNFQYSTHRHSLRFAWDLQPIYNSSQVDAYFGGPFLFGQAIPLAALIDQHSGISGFSQGLAQVLPAGLTTAFSDPITSLRSYSLGRPLAYLQGFGNSVFTSWRQNHTVFGQDHWRPVPQLTLSLGLRYQMDWPSAIRNMKTLDPRVGFGWALENSVPSVICGGIGLFHQGIMPPIPFGQVEINRSDDSMVVLPLNGVAGVINPQTGSLLTSADIYQSLLARGVLGTRPIAQADLAALGMLAGFRFSEKGGIQADYHSPYSEQYNLGVEQSFQSLVVSASFVFSRTDLWRVRDHNLVKLGTQPNGLPLIGRQDQNFANICYDESAANGFYTAASLQVSRRVRRYWSFDAHYTLSRATDEVTDFNVEYQPNNQFDARGDRGLSPFHQKHRFGFSGVFQSPWADTAGRHRFLYDWMLSASTQAHFFQPFNINTGNDNVGDGQTTTHRPIGLGRDTGIGSNFVGMNAQVMRTLRVGSEKSRVSFLIEGFNISNRTNFQSVNKVVGDIPLAALPKPLVGSRSDPTLPFSFTAANERARSSSARRFLFE